MINNILNNESNAMSNLLAENKDKIIAVAKKRAEEETGESIPTSREEFETQLQSKVTNLDLNTSASEQEVQEVLSKVDEEYNRVLPIINKAIKKLEDGKNELTSIRDRFTKIEDKLAYLDSFIEILNPIFGLIDTALLSIDAGLAASSSTLANGSIINRLGEIKIKLKELVTKGKGVLDSISEIKEYFEGEIKKISDPLDKGISGFEKQLQNLTTLRDTMELVYTTFTQQLLSRLEDND